MCRPHVHLTPGVHDQDSRGRRGRWGDGPLAQNPLPHNFTNRPAPSESLYPVASWERLGAIRDQMDPDRLLVLSHPIGS